MVSATHMFVKVDVKDEDEENIEEQHMAIVDGWRMYADYVQIAQALILFSQRHSLKYLRRLLRPWQTGPAT